MKKKLLSVVLALTMVLSVLSPAVSAVVIDRPDRLDIEAVDITATAGNLTVKITTDPMVASGTLIISSEQWVTENLGELNQTTLENEWASASNALVNSEGAVYYARDAIQSADLSRGITAKIEARSIGPDGTDYGYASGEQIDYLLAYRSNKNTNYSWATFQLDATGGLKVVKTPLDTPAVTLSQSTDAKGGLTATITDAGNTDDKAEALQKYQLQLYSKAACEEGDKVGGPMDVALDKVTGFQIDAAAVSGGAKPEAGVEYWAKAKAVADPESAVYEDSPYSGAASATAGLITETLTLSPKTINYDPSENNRLYPAVTLASGRAVILNYSVDSSGDGDGVQAELLNGKPLSAGKYTVKNAQVAANAHYKAIAAEAASAVLTINRIAYLPLSETLTPVQPSEAGAADGKITGLSSGKAYEYSTDQTFAAGVTAVEAGKSEITGLGAGTYYVRYALSAAQKRNYIPGAASQATVSAGTVKYDYIINYNDGATPNTTSRVQSGTAQAKPGDPVRTGYTFKGWYTAATGGTAVTWPLTITADTTVYAQWLENISNVSVTDIVEPAALEVPDTTTGTPGSGDYTITGIRWTPGAEAFAGNTVYTVSVTVTAAAGKTFTAATGTPTVNGNLSSFTPPGGPVNQITFAYEFEATDPVLTIHNGDGRDGVSTQVVPAGTQPVKPGDPVWAEHTFKGWYTTKTGDTLFLWANPITANTDVYAQWLTNITGVNVTEVTPPATGGTPDTTGTSGAASYQVESVSWSPAHTPFQAETVYTATVTVKSGGGYAFTGATTAQLNGMAATSVIQPVAADTLVYTYEFPATAAEPAYVITVEAGQGGSVADGTLSGKTGAVVNISATADQGYTFAGWTGGTPSRFGDAAQASTTYTIGGENETIRATFTAGQIGFGDKTLTEATMGVPYTGAVTPATGGSGDGFTYEITADQPAWLSMAADGSMSGTPTAMSQQPVRFTVTATDVTTHATAAAVYTIPYIVGVQAVTDMAYSADNVVYGSPAPTLVTPPVFEPAGTIVYTSSDEDVLTVDENGGVTIHKIGTATVTATNTVPGYLDGSSTYEITVTIGEQILSTEPQAPVGEKGESLTFTVANSAGAEGGTITAQAGTDGEGILKSVAYDAASKTVTVELNDIAGTAEIVLEAAAVADKYNAGRKTVPIESSAKALLTTTIKIPERITPGKITAEITGPEAEKDGYDIQWFVAGEKQTEASGEQFTVTEAMHGKTIQAKVAAKADSNFVGTNASELVKVIPNPPELKSSTTTSLTIKTFGDLEYGYGKTDAPEEAQWTIPGTGSDADIKGLSTSTTYYIFARVAADKPLVSEPLKAKTKSSGGGGGGGGGGSTVTYRTVTFDPGEHGTLKGSSTERVANGAQSKNVPEVEAKDGYVFKGWSLDGETVTDPKENTVTKDVTYLAVYEAGSMLTEEHVQYVNGYKDGTFRPDMDITRAEAVTIFARLMKTPMDPEKKYRSSFSDADGWYADYIGFMEGYGIIKGYEDGTFRPNQVITRAEFAVIATRFGELKPSDTNVFKDVDDELWAKEAILTAYANGWVNGYPDGTFRPTQGIARAEVVKIVNSMLDRIIYEASIAEAEYVTFSDVEKSHWAYYYVIEASQTHDYEKRNGVEMWVEEQEKEE